jgi:hypothetical protein
VASELARELLSRVARGAAVLEAELDELASMVLGHEFVQLVMQVREPGPHRLRRALELAALLVAPERHDTNRAAEDP